MEQVRLAWKNEQQVESQRGIRISRFLKEHELVIGRDYTWRLDTTQKEIVFMFDNNAQMWASMISMKEL